MVSGNFITLVALASAPACPMGWYLMNSWLTQSVYRIEIEWSLLAVTGLLALLLTLTTVRIQTVRAARTNPVDALRYE